MDTSRQLFSHSSHNASALGKDDNIKVVVRVRPLNEIQLAKGGRKCIKDVAGDSNTIVINTPDSKQFTYDFVANEEHSQQDLFRRVAMPVANYCLEGYNGTIFAYGQTGAGKTFTIQGPSTSLRANISEEDLGIMPRVFSYIFGQIELASQRSDITFLVKCRYIEIYMEKVFDLLDPEMPQLQLRQDLRRGVYVQNSIQEHVTSAREAMELQRRGATNRHIGETAMNKESSRSHSIFTLMIEQKEVKDDGLCNLRMCQFHLIDLAGSERQKRTGAEGERLKEASNINLSLTNLGTVINILSEGKQEHIPYRNSKITFLLRDSLGGNSKTVIVANVSPSSLNINESISTLNFAKRAKLIKNKAIINQDTTGTVSLLRQEISRLKKKLTFFQNQNTLSFLGSPIPRGGDLDSELGLEQSQREMQLEALLIQNNDLLISQQKVFEAEIASKDREIAELRRTVQVQENVEKRNVMMLKMKEEALKRYKKNGPEALQEHVKDLMEEIKMLKDTEQYKNPHVARLMSENTSLKEQLRLLKKESGDDAPSLFKHLHEANNFLEELNEYIHQTYSLRSELQEKLERVGSSDIVMRGASEDSDDKVSPRDFKRADDSLSSKEIQEQSNQRFLELEELLQQRTETYETKVFELNEVVNTKQIEMEEMKEKFETKLAQERERLNEAVEVLKKDLVTRDNKDIPELKFQIVKLEEEVTQATQTATQVMNQLEKVNNKYMDSDATQKEQRKIISNLQMQLDEKEKQESQNAKLVASLKKEGTEQKSLTLYLKTENKQLQDKLYEQQKKVSSMAAERQALNDQVQTQKEMHLQLSQEFQTLQTAHSYKQTELEDQTSRTESLTKDLTQANGVISDLKEQVDGMQQVVTRIQEEKEGDSSALQVSMEQIAKLQEELGETKQVMTQLKSTVSARNMELSAVGKKHAIAIEERDTMSQKVRDVLSAHEQTRTELAEKYAMIESSTEEIIQLKKKIDESEQERVRVGRELDDLKLEREEEREDNVRQSEDIMERVRMLDCELKETSEENKELKRLMKEQKDKLRSQESEMTHLKPTLNSLNDENRELRNEISKLDREKRDTERQKEEALLKMQDEFKGFRKAMDEWSTKVETKNDSIMTLRAESHHLKSELEIMKCEKQQNQHRCRDLEVRSGLSAQKKLRESEERLYEARNFGQKFYDSSNEQVQKANELSEGLVIDKRKAERERDDYKNRFEVLQQEMEKQQDNYEAELAKLQEEVQAMEEEQLRFLGHGNKKQKINILQDLKIENNDLKTRNRKAESECFRWKTTIKDITAMLDDYVPELRDFLANQRVSEDERAILNVKQIIEKFKDVQKNLDSQRIRVKMAELNTNSPSPQKRPLHLKENHHKMAHQSLDQNFPSTHRSASYRTKP